MYKDKVIKLGEKLNHNNAAFLHLPICWNYFYCGWRNWFNTQTKAEVLKG